MELKVLITILMVLVAVLSFAVIWLIIRVNGIPKTDQETIENFKKWVINVSNIISRLEVHIKKIDDFSFAPGQPFLTKEQFKAFEAKEKEFTKWFKDEVNNLKEFQQMVLDGRIKLVNQVPKPVKKTKRARK